MADYEFDPYHYRSVTRGAPVKFRGVSATIGGGFEEPTSSHFLSTFEKEDTLIIKTEEQPPALPYSWEVCSSNTFAPKDSSTSPQSLIEKLKEIIRKSPADITTISEWEFDAVFYPQQTKTALKVSMFDNNAAKNSCLIEMQLQEGDRVAFQGLVSYARSQAGLVYAFADEWGFEDDKEEEELTGEYKHCSFAPLPLPSSLAAKMDSIDVISGDFSIIDFEDSKHSLAEVLLENTCSLFADVRRTGWQELANASNETAFAESLTAARAYDQDCFSLATTVLQATAACDVTADTQRCALKTLANIAKTGNKDACQKIFSLKPQIIRLAADMSKNNSVETRATAVQLMQCLAQQRSKSVDKEFLSALVTHSHDKCRVGDFARHALSSLQLIST